MVATGGWWREGLPDRVGGGLGRGLARDRGGVGWQRPVREGAADPGGGQPDRPGRGRVARAQAASRSGGGVGRPARGGDGRARRVPVPGRELVVLAAGALWFVGVGPLVASHRTMGRGAGPSTGEEPGGLGRQGQGIWPPCSLTRVRSELSVPSLECRTPLRRDRHVTHPGRCKLEGGDKACFACSRGAGREPRWLHSW